MARTRSTRRTTAFPTGHKPDTTPQDPQPVKKNRVTKRKTAWEDEDAVSQPEQKKLKFDEKYKIQCEAQRLQNPTMKNILVICTNNHEEETVAEIGPCLIRNIYQDQVDEILNFGDSDHVTNHSCFDGADEYHRYTFGDVDEVRVYPRMKNGERIVEIQVYVVVPELDGKRTIIFSQENKCDEKTESLIHDEFTSVDRYSTFGIFQPHVYTIVLDAAQHAQMNALVKKQYMEDMIRIELNRGTIYE